MTLSLRDIVCSACGHAGEVASQQPVVMSRTIAPLIRLRQLPRKGAFLDLHAACRHVVIIKAGDNCQREVRGRAVKTASRGYAGGATRSVLTARTANRRIYWRRPTLTASRLCGQSSLAVVPHSHPELDHRLQDAPGHVVREGDDALTVRRYGRRRHRQAGRERPPDQGLGPRSRRKRGVAHAPIASPRLKRPAAKNAAEPTGATISIVLLRKGLAAIPSREDRISLTFRALALRSGCRGNTPSWGAFPQVFPLCGALDGRLPTKGETRRGQVVPGQSAPSLAPASIRWMSFL